MRAFESELTGEKKTWWKDLIEEETKKQDQCCVTCLQLRSEAMRLAIEVTGARKMEQRQVDGGDNGSRERRLRLERAHAKALRDMGKHLQEDIDSHPRAQVPLLGLARFRSTVPVEPANNNDGQSSSDSHLDFTNPAGDVSDAGLPPAGSDSAELSDALDEHDHNPVCWMGIEKPLIITNETAMRARVPHPRITVDDLAIVRLADMNPDWGVAKVLKIRTRSRSLKIQWFGQARHSANAAFKPM